MMIRKILAVIWLGLFLAGCAAVAPLPPTSTAPPALPTPTVTPTEYRGLCAYVWSEQRMPELSDQVNRVLRRAALEQVEAIVTGYGETCVDSGANRIVSFTPQEINYSLILRVEDVSDARALGDWLTQIILALADFQSTQVREGKPGRVEVEFQDASRAVVASFPLIHAQELVNQGVKGEGLFDQLAQP